MKQLEFNIVDGFYKHLKLTPFKMIKFNDKIKNDIRLSLNQLLNISNASFSIDDILKYGAEEFEGYVI